MSRLEQLKYLLVMAASDGGCSEEELRLLSDRAQQWGISLDEFETIVQEATDNNVDLDSPAGRPERRQILTDLVHMMGADGRLHPTEKELFAALATRWCFSQEDVDQIVDDATGAS